VNTVAGRQLLDLYLCSNDISLHAFQNLPTLLKSKPDFLGYDSDSATVECCDLFHGQSLISEAGFNPDDEFYERLLGCLLAVSPPPRLLQSGGFTPTFDTVPRGHQSHLADARRILG
jgi:hypothetical protein